MFNKTLEENPVFNVIDFDFQNKKFYINFLESVGKMIYEK